MQIRRQSSLALFPVTFGILALIVAAFVAETVAGGSQDGRVLLHLGANFPPYILEQGEWWRMLTSALLHIGLLHLAVNGWALWQLGRLSELTFGSERTLIVFVFTALTASLFTLLTIKISAGASGALFGLEGALVVFFLRHRDRLTPAGKHLLGQLLLWTAIMFVFSFTAPGIDWLAHLGGFVGGAAIGAILRPSQQPVNAGTRLLATVAAGMLASAFIIVLLRVGGSMG